MEQEETPVWLSQDVHNIVARKRKKQGVWEYSLTMFTKGFRTNVEAGYPRWTSFIRCLRKEVARLPKTDYIVGITSGGYIIAEILAHFRKETAVKLTYSQYNSEDIGDFCWRRGCQLVSRLDLMKFETPKVQLNIPEDAIWDKTCLLVDDSSGSGGTMRTCAKYLRDLGAKRVITYLFTNSMPDRYASDFCYTHNHCMVLPWGFDV